MSLPACPKCGSPISGEAGFGMVMCEKCGELVLLNGDDAPVEVVAAPPEEAPAFEAFSSDPPTDSPADLPPIPEYEAAPAENVAEAFASFAVTPEVEFGVTTPAPPPVLDEKGETFQDVADFGNQDQPSSGSGALVYDIKIQGIDTAEIREDLMACLNDSRLQLDPASLLSQVRHGELEIKKLNPVKASVILTRLKHLPFTVMWTSHQMIKGAKVLVAFLVCFHFMSLPALAEEEGAHPKPPPAKRDETASDEKALKRDSTRIGVTQNEIKELIEKKNKNRDPIERDKILEEIVKKNQELQNLYQSFRDEKQRLLHEHPDQGDKTERKYHHLKFKSLSEIENESGVDGQLTQIKAKIDETYKPPEKKEPVDPVEKPAVKATATPLPATVKPGVKD